jgi:hypothetical protein
MSDEQPDKEQEDTPLVQIFLHPDEEGDVLFGENENCRLDGIQEGCVFFHIWSDGHEESSAWRHILPLTEVTLIREQR